MGSYVYNSGNLVLDLLYNLMLESTGRLQKCRLYEMTANKTARTTIAYLIVRDQAHENAYAKALETLGVNWGATLPIPKTHAEKFPEVKKLLDLGLHTQQPHFGLDGASELAKIFQGPSPMNDGTTLSVPDAPDGFPVPVARERFEEFSPGLDPALLELVQATADMEMAVTPGGATGAPGTTLSVPDAPEGFPVPVARERFEEFSPGLDPALLELVQATADMELAVTPGGATGAPGSGAGLADKVKDKLT